MATNRLGAEAVAEAVAWGAWGAEAESPRRAYRRAAVAVAEAWAAETGGDVRPEAVAETAADAVAYAVARYRLAEAGDRLGDAATWAGRAAALAEAHGATWAAEAVASGAPHAPYHGVARTRRVWRGAPILRVSPARRYAVPMAPAEADATVYTLASFPTKLHSVCRHRGAMVVVPSYSLPPAESCPGAVYTAEAAAEAEAATLAAVAEAFGAEAEAVAEAVASAGGAHSHANGRAVCGGCYAIRLARMRANVADAHAARWRDVLPATRAWARTGRLIGAARRLRWAETVAEAVARDLSAHESEAMPPTVARVVAEAHASEAETAAEAVAIWAAYGWRVVAAMAGGLSRQAECADCTAGGLRARWHMMGDIFSAPYAELLRHVIWATLAETFPTLRTWAPTRSWHESVPPRLRAAVDSLATWGAANRVNVSASALTVGATVPEAVARRYGGASAVAATVADVPRLGRQYAETGACYAQTESPTHACGDCTACYLVGARVPYIWH